MQQVSSDTYDFIIHFENVRTWLLLLIVLLIFSLTIVGLLLYVIGHYIREIDEQGINPDPILTGKRISAILLTLKYSDSKLPAIFRSMPDSSYRLLRKWLKVDFIFMAFLYPLLLLLIIWFNKYVLTKHSAHLNFILIFYAGLIVFVWIMDIAENMLALAAFKMIAEELDNQCYKMTVKIMRVCALFKWISLSLYALGLILFFFN